MTVITLPLHNQGYVANQPYKNTPPHQSSQLGNRNYKITMMDSEEINLKTQSCQYENPHDNLMIESLCLR